MEVVGAIVLLFAESVYFLDIYRRFALLLDGGSCGTNNRQSSEYAFDGGVGLTSDSQFDINVHLDEDAGAYQFLDGSVGSVLESSLS